MLPIVDSNNISNPLLLGSSRYLDDRRPVLWWSRPWLVGSGMSSQLPMTEISGGVLTVTVVLYCGGLTHDSCAVVCSVSSPMTEISGVLVVTDVLYCGSLTHDLWAVISGSWWWPMSCVVVVSPMTRGQCYEQSTAQ